MDPRGLVLHQGGVGVVLEAWYPTRAVQEGSLEAWYYTRAAGTDLVHRATTGSISTAARGVDIQGVVIKY